MGSFPNPETQFKPGQSGNPTGTSKRRRVFAALEKLLDETVPEGADLIAKTIFAKAVGLRRLLKDDREDGGYREPDLRYLELIIERLEGRAAEAPATEGGADAALVELREALNQAQAAHVQERRDEQSTET